MALLRARTPLTPAERIAKRRLIFKDSLALLGLFAITAILAVLTFLLFRSYSQHQKDAAARWLRRGEAAMRAGKPGVAVNALHSALAYAPGDRRAQIELAEALAADGKVQEATVYFNTLWEGQPGSGLINLQLARLALASGRTAAALQYYHASIYGTWEGDGAVRRREVRLELVRHLLALNMFQDARNELLIAAGNADDNDIGDRLNIANLLMAAHAPADALRLYKELAAHRPAPPDALTGAGHAAFVLGHYREAQSFLQRALSKQGGPALPAPPAARDSTLAQPLDHGISPAAARSELADATRILDLYPAISLPPRARAQRVLDARAIARKRLDACAAVAANAAAPSPAPPSPAPPQPSRPRPSMRLLFTPAPAPNAVPASPVPLSTPDAQQALAARWAAEPQRLTAADLLRDPAREQSEIALVYDTELVTASTCGAPAGDDALLLRIAQAPEAVEQQ